MTDIKILLDEYFLLITTLAKSNKKKDLKILEKKRRGVKEAIG